MPKLRTGVLLAVAAAVLLSGCKRGQQNTSRPAKESTKPPNGSTLAIAGRMLAGADQTTIRSYLQTVQEVKPKKFSVQWSPDTVPVSREEAMRSLQSINEDGSLYSFASSDPVVARLAPGRILWIWNIAIRRIDSIAKMDNVTLVHTKPVALTEALPQADIEFEALPNFADAYGALRPHSPKKQAVPQNTSGLFHRPSYRPVSLNTSGPDAPAPGQQPRGQDDPPPPEDEDDYGVVAATQDGYNGQIAGFEYSMQYKVSASRLSYEFEARKEEEKSGSPENSEIHRDQRQEYFELVKEQREALHEERVWYAKILQLDQQLHAADQQAVSSASAKPGTKWALQYMADRQEAVKEYAKQKEEAEQDEIKIKALAAAGALAKQVFYIISDNLDVRFRGKMDLDRAAFSGNIQTAGGSLKQFAAHFSEMKGNVELEFVGRLGQPGNGAVSVPVVNVPVVMNIPVPVGGIPLVVQFATNFMVKLFLSGNHATQHFSTRFQFGGGAGMDSTSQGTNTEGNLSGTEPEVESKTAESPGTSGLVLAVQLPRFGLGVGFLGASGMAYMDLVHVLTMTNSASVATLNPPCHRLTFDTIGSVGLDVSVMPIPIPLVQSVASKALSQRKEVWRRSPPWKYINPDIAMCRLSGD